MRIIPFIGVLMILGLMAGCSAQTKREILQFFFDGYPPKEEAPTDENLENTEPKETIQANPGTSPSPAIPPKAARPVFYRHDPYASGDCDLCHLDKSSQKLSAEGKELCFSCHDDFLENVPVKHYPAEEGMCVDCHNPHRSPNQHLLQKAVRQLCFDCHDQDEVTAMDFHEDIGEEDCTLCHSPHGGDESLLR